MNNLGIQSPWVTTYNKVKALFERDDDVIISNIDKVDGGYTFAISSANSVKLSAIEKILKKEFTFGNVTLTVNFEYLEDTASTITVNDFKNAFAGNNILSFVKTVPTPQRVDKSFVVFARDVIQFYNDDISDLYGNYNGLAEDIARELFNDADVSYSTDVNPAN